MKKCPFCAEEIQDEAIKCRYCNSFLDEAEKPAAVAPLLSPALVDPAKPAATPRSPNRTILYSGSPSWRAYFQKYAWCVLAALVLPVVGYWISVKFAAPTSIKVLSVLLPLVLAAAAFAILHYYRRSKVVRVTGSNIEVEHGFFSRKIDVLELWRCRDIQYRQSFFDRLLFVAHIDIYTADVTTPNVCIVGLPASRELFENIRDSIEIQKQSRNVLGMIQ